MIAPDFETVARLSAQEQQRLLDGGDSPERLWAAWALALQIGRNALPLLSSVEQGEISEGLRRQLLVVLAGLGERRLLETIANIDPTPSVQATAAMLYIRTAGHPSGPEAAGFALRQLRAGPPEVRRAILDEYQVGNLSLPTVELLPSLRDADTETRILCAACVLSGCDAHHAVRAVVEALGEEHDPGVRRHFLSRLPRSAISHVFADAVPRGAAAIRAAVSAVHELYDSLTWAEVRCLAAATTLDIGAAILASGVQPEPLDGLPWLCRVLRLSLAGNSDAARDARWRCLSAIESSLTPETVGFLNAADRDMVRGLFEKTLDDYRDELEAYVAGRGFTDRFGSVPERCAAACRAVRDTSRDLANIRPP